MHLSVHWPPHAQGFSLDRCRRRCLSLRAAAAPAPRNVRHATVCGLPFDPPAFNPAKLSVAYEPGMPALESLPLSQRRYTLTHNDLTGALLLTVGRQWNAPQLSGWYIRLLRDEVLAEWQQGEDGLPALHVYCHVSGQERWLAPPQLRNYIFKREMPLVLGTLAWAEREMLAAHPEYAAARVFVHFNSSLQELNCTVEWGQLGFHDTWRRVPSSILRRLLLAWRAPLYASSDPAAAQRSSALRRRSLLARLDDSVDEEDFVAVAAASAAAADAIADGFQISAAAAVAVDAELTAPSAAAASRDVVSQPQPAQRDLLAADALEAATPELREADAAIQDASAEAEHIQCVDALPNQRRATTEQLHDSINRTEGRAARTESHSEAAAPTAICSNGSIVPVISVSTDKQRRAPPDDIDSSGGGDSTSRHSNSRHSNGSFDSRDEHQVSPDSHRLQLVQQLWGSARSSATVACASQK